MDNSDEDCTATKLTPTANGDLSVPCAKPASHVERGDVIHEGKVGVFPVRWPDRPAER